MIKKIIMKKLNFIKKTPIVDIWEAKTPLGTYGIMQITPDIYTVDYTGLDVANKTSTLSTDKVSNFDAAVESAQRHSDKQIKLILNWVDNG